MYRTPPTGEAMNHIYSVNQRSFNYNGKWTRNDTDKGCKEAVKEGRIDEKGDGKPSGEEEI